MALKRLVKDESHEKLPSGRTEKVARSQASCLQMSVAQFGVLKRAKQTDISSATAKQPAPRSTSRPIPAGEVQRSVGGKRLFLLIRTLGRVPCGFLC